MPDTLTVYGQAPGIVDVLANDLDPSGGLLVVQRAAGDRAGQLDVAIIDGRWLRISAVQPLLAPRTQTVSYTISNGTSSGVRGEVVVTQRPAPADNTPVTVADKVVVRAGSAVSAPVLDNDVSPAGDRLTLLGDLVDSETPGQLDVVAPVDVTGDVGKAFVSGRVVRYVAPDEVEERDTYTVTYVAQNLDGKRANGRLQVTVVPDRRPQRRAGAAHARGPRGLRRHRQGPRPRRRGGPQRRPRDRHRHHLGARAWAASRPTAATSWSTRPTRAPSAPTSSAMPSSTPRVRSRPAPSASPWSSRASRSRPWRSRTGSPSSRAAPRRSTRWPTTSSRPATPWRSSSSATPAAPGSTPTPTWSPCRRPTRSTRRPWSSSTG